MMGQLLFVLAFFITLSSQAEDLSKLEAGKPLYSMRARNLVEIATVVRNEMSAFAEEKSLSLVLLNPDKEIIGLCDSEKIMQVLRNIVTNAIKFSKKGSSVRISFFETSDKVRCQVTNQGVGIPLSEIESIFDKFVQSSKTKTGAGGTGLGLAICKEILRHHEGNIWAESEENGETRFIFELPLFSAQA